MVVVVDCAAYVLLNLTPSLAISRCRQDDKAEEMYQQRDERAARAKPLVLYIGALTASWRKVVGAVVPNH